MIELSVRTADVVGFFVRTGYIAKGNVMKKCKWVKRVFIVLLCLAITAGMAVLGINARVKSVGKKYLLTAQEATGLMDVDCILVLGCLVRSDGSLSSMLRDRLVRGVELYQLGAAPKLLMSGDHGRKDYDEVNTMKAYAISEGVPSSDVFMDHAGFSTYESMYRAKDIFVADKIIIVSQEYHLYRALYVARALGLEAYGVAADGDNYGGQTYREVREILARAKDAVYALLKPEPKYRGEVIPVSGNGDLTND